MVLARVVFAIAGIAGIIAVFVRIPGVEDWSDLSYSAILLSWQIVFLIVASDPIRFRPVMIPAVLEKLLYVGIVLGPAVAGRIPDEEPFLAPVIVHGAFGVFFAIAFAATTGRSRGLRAANASSAGLAD